MRSTPDLGSVPVFRHLDVEERAELEAMLEPEDFDAGQAIFREGGPEGRLYVITSGTVEVHSACSASVASTWRLSRRQPWWARWGSSPNPGPPRPSRP